MRNAKLTHRLPAMLLCFVMMIGLGSCGTTSAHFGLDHDVAYNWNGGYYENGHHHHKPPKPPKKKKHKKPKPPKKKKNKKHHDD